jgi:hypothetical protein
VPLDQVKLMTRQLKVLQPTIHCVNVQEHQNSLPTSSPLLHMLSPLVVLGSLPRIALTSEVACWLPALHTSAVYDNLPLETVVHGSFTHAPCMHAGRSPTWSPSAS